MTQREGIQKFENDRIKALQEERLHIQKKTFTKWMNSFLIKAKMEVEDLFTDLADGIKLLKLLEIISGEKLGKPNSGKMRVHKIENVNKSLAFLHTKVRLESIGAEDIVDGNPRLILGLIWTIILRFQIQEIEIDVDEEDESSEKKSAKDALLLWCQRKTYGYQGVHIQDFTNSWRSGLGFNALIHSHRPDLFDYSQLQPGRNIENLNHAFDVASTELGIPRLLDAEDIDTTRPDEKSVLTYVASYYHTFARMKNEQKSGKRIANIVGKLMDADKKKIHYERLTSDLLTWIRSKTRELEKRNFPNSLEGIQKELLVFKEYRTIEKPPKYKERSEIEALYFHINTLLKSLNQPHYTPQDGQLINDIERAWQKLENAEHSREVALRDELMRQEKLEQLNYKFEKKSVLREGYLKEMIQVLSDPRYGSNLVQVDATVKKHEAISADILARVERFKDLTAMANELIKERYHGSDRVKKREEEVLEKWQELLDLLEKHKTNLLQMSGLMNLMREIDATIVTIKGLQVQFASEDVGPHLLGVEELLQAHSLQELQVTTLGETQKRFTRQGDAFKKSNSKDLPLLNEKFNEFNQLYLDLLNLSAQRKARLEEARDFYHFLEDHENEEGWLIDKQRICKAGITAKDLRAVMSLQQKHKTLEDEMKARKPKSIQLKDIGKKLMQEKHPRATEVTSRMDSLQEHWKALEDLVELRKRQLDDAAEAYQFYTDANEADSWLNEKMSLVASNDFGVDEPSAQALLQRHRDLQGELNAYSGDILNLNQQADKLIKAGICTLELSNEPETIPEEVEQEEWVNETRLVPKEVWDEEPVERLEHKTVTEYKMFPHVKAMYSYEGQGMKMAKGEILILHNKTNPDWWSVRKLEGQEGFVPASYVREIEPRQVPCLVRKAEKVKTTQKVKKTILVKEIVPVKRIKPAKASQVRPLVKRRAEGETPVDSNDSVEKRQKRINGTYDQLQDLAQRRHALLEDSIRLFGFYKECDDFEKWIKDKEKLLKTEDPNDNVEVAKRKFEKFLTDLSASSKRIDSLDGAVNEFVRQGHSQLDKVKARQRQIHQLWDHLNYLKSRKEKSLEGASSVELFNRTCEEAVDWMHEKMMQLDTAELGPDLKTVKALQRRHENLERELAPVQEKVNRVNLLGNSVKDSYVSEKANVTERQKQIQDMLQKVQSKALERRSRLENAVGQQIFTNSAKSLFNWVDDIKNQIAQEETAKDVTTAENLRKKHYDLGEEIDSQDDEFREVLSLGKNIYEKNPSLKEIPAALEKLQKEQKEVRDAWKEKEQYLQQSVELQIFNREADKIDATTKSHEAFLEYMDLGTSLDDVEAILKRHNDFENTLAAQDKVCKGFSDHADKLIQAQHYDSAYINERRRQVLAKRQKVKDLAAQRRAALQNSKDYQQFVSDVDDLNTWLDDKIRIASDQSYKDLSNLPRKLQNHKAFDRELRANEGQLRSVNKNGESLIKRGNRANEVQQALENANQKWKNLMALSLEKGRRLEQAGLQREHNRNIEDAKTKLVDFETVLQSKQVGQDLRSCKELLNKHQIVEQDITMWEQKITELVAFGEEMAHEGHFDAPNIQKETKKLQNQFKTLHSPIRHRRAALEESLKFHKFVFELDTELQWINERATGAGSDQLGQNLHQAQSLFKKHKKLEAEIEGHQPMIDKALASGRQFIEKNHPEKKQVEKLCNDLQEAWEDLQDKSDIRSKKLDQSLKAQQYLSEAGEIETWLGEKNNVLRSTDYGRDRDSATKLLTKHKAIELELDTYSGIVSEMGHTASTMIAAKHPDSKVIAAKQQLIEKMLKSLQKLAAQRQQRLIESLHRHEYFAEAAELEQWIKEQEQAAASEDYGQDYEHLLLLQNKFDDLKHRIEIGAERFHQCEESAKKLISSENSYVSEIEKCQEQLKSDNSETTTSPTHVITNDDVIDRNESVCNVWRNLLDLLSQREQRLYAAGEIHRFHRDVAEALFRIQDKNAALSNELGKDLNSALALDRKHEVFENDLVATEAQLQVLVEDSVRLKNKYPGENAETIEKQQEMVVAAWNDLKEKSAHRSDQLAASCDLQNFLTQVRDLMSWASNLRAAIQTEEHVSDAPGATALKIQHDGIYNEIEAREEKFRYLSELSDSMVQTGHYAAAEVEEKCTALLDERQKLHSAWNKKKVLLEQKIDLFCFLRDAKQIDNISSSQEAALKNLDFGQSVEVVQDQVRRHDAFEKLIKTQDEKVVILQDHGRKLVEQNHYDSANIRKRLQEVIHRRQQVKELCAIQRQKLANALLYAQFIRDTAEALAWINEKQKRLEADVGNLAEVTSLEDKIKKLQKHQAFQAEISANEGRIAEVKQKGDTLIDKKHEHSPEIKETLKKLVEAWGLLMKEVDSRGRGLEEAQDILEFNNQLEKIEAWKRDKELMIQAGDTGRDLEHCNALRRKLDDVDSDMRVDEQRIESINILADKLLSQEKGPNEMKNVEERRTEFNNQWKQLQAALNKYREQLDGAYEVHVFHKDVDDTSERIAEKSLAMSVEDTGKDLAAVEALQRKQEALERDMTAVEQKIVEHEKAANKLRKQHPERVPAIDEKLGELKRNWEHLQNLSLKRKKVLSDGYTIHKFIADVKELEAWVNDICKKMDSAPMPNTIPECETQIQLHNERKAEIDGRSPILETLKEQGEQLSSKDKDVLKSVHTLELLKSQVQYAWKDKAKRLKEAHQLQLFKEQADRIDEWLATKEAFLNNDDLGNSFKTVEALIKKHEAFVKLLGVNRTEELEKFAEEILAEDPYEADLVKQRLYAVQVRRDKLFEMSALRGKKLEESLQLQLFLRNLYEVERWLNQKMQVVCDENYRDPSNLQSKIQKHAAFDLELHANNARITNCLNEGETLINNEHYASDDIAQQLELLQTEWAKLQEASQQKRDRLQQAYEALVFGRSLDEFNIWMDEIESHLSSEDYGRDLASVNTLLKKHEMLEADVAHHAEVAEQLKETDEKFLKSDHFMKDEMHERAMLSIKRYHSLHEPTSIRRDNLEDSLLLHQFLRDTEDELAWLTEKEPIAASKDLGTSLTAVQSLQKKHQALEAEILSREPIISGILHRGQQMIRDGHFASEDIEQHSNNLQKKLVQVRDLASVRRLRLLDAVESQLFYVEANEAESWIREKRPILASGDCGKDEGSVLSLQKKLESIQREIVAFEGSTLNKVVKLATNLLERNHFDSEKIQAKNDKIQKQFEELKKFAVQKERKLIEAKKLFEFLREVEELHEWINEQMAVAASEEYGTDVEHVELLTASFEAFVSNLGSNESRVISCVGRGEVLINENNPNTELIKQKRDETKQLWEELKDLVTARQEALAGARQVHVYDRTADETIAWIHEKISALISEDYGTELEVIQALVRQHEAFETELKAVKDQIEAVQNDANKLSETFPDAAEHIEVKKEETIEAWADLLERTKLRKLKLEQAEQLQAYFDEYRDIMAWINEMLAQITAPELAKDVDGAEQLINRIKDHQTEAKSRNESFEKFYATGKRLIAEEHFLSNEVQEKISILQSRKALLDSTLVKRQELYELNLDTQIFLRDAELLEKWIINRQLQLKDTKLGDSIAQVEDLIRKHEDFEKTLAAQEDKINGLKRITMLEQLFKKQREDEENARRSEFERIEKERIEALKQKEVQRITEERRRNEKKMDQNGYSDKKMATVQENSGISVQKSNSFVNLFGDKLRRNSGDANVKRAESMKIQPKLPKRTPSFTTRRRAQSFRKTQKPEGVDLPPVEIQGTLERKHELLSGGKRSPVRSWKPFHTVLCGQLLCFFKDENDFMAQKAATAPVNILNSKCEKAGNYTKKKNVFRLSLPDGSEFLFLAHSVDEMNDWITKIAFHASLPPNLQLMSYDESLKQQSMSLVTDVKNSSGDLEVSSVSNSSRASTPDVPPQHRSNNRNDSFSSAKSQNSNSSTPQTDYLMKQKELRERERRENQMMSAVMNQTTSPGNANLADKPPIPPRGAPPQVPQRQSSYETVNANVQLRQKNLNGNDEIDNGNEVHHQQRPYSLQPHQSIQTRNGNQNGNEDSWKRSSEVRLSEKPPLPTAMPPQIIQHQRQQHYFDPQHGNVATTSTYTKMTTFQPIQQPGNGSNVMSFNNNQQLLHQQQQQMQFYEKPSPIQAQSFNLSHQRPSPPRQNVNTWHQHTTTKTTYSPGINDPNIAFINNESAGWGQSRFDSGRPVSLPPQPDNLSVSTRMSAESSSESEASVNKGSSKDKEKKSGMFRMFSKKKSKSPNQ
ncbi:spectrin beta chain, non-erythrocytic 5 isoform X3 [Culicoides brevitarsis]